MSLSATTTASTPEATLGLDAAADGLLTVAEAIAVRVLAHGVVKVYAYPGTSELALCQAFAAAGEGTLVNARGDGEAVFMAGGGGLLGQPAAVAIVHGARGLTNAAGAVADLRRNEVPTLVIVGLPSTRSARFLPPHAEDGLMAGIGRFARDYRELSWPVGGRRRPPLDPVGVVDAAMAAASSLPPGPVLLGVPQDILESRQVPPDALGRPLPSAAAPVIDARALRRARALLRGALSPVVLVDDFMLRHEGAMRALVAFAEQFGAVVLQVRHRRGPMLFPQVPAGGHPLFMGSYDPGRVDHRGLMARADLLVTLEDRNLYRRVVGPLPDCPKIAVTSDARKTRRNGYLTTGDVVIDGPPVTVLDRLGQTRRRVSGASSAATGVHPPETDKATDDAATWLRIVLAEAVWGCLEATGSGHVVDDSQMVGGVLADAYAETFGDARVMGDHGGFVGAGISLATGLALTHDLPVVCLLGDQGFTNGFQGLVGAAQEGAKVLYLVWNNGESVSLRKQVAGLDAGSAGDFERLLRNPPTFSYTAAAAAAGVRVGRVDLRPDVGRTPPSTAAARVVATVKDLWTGDGPVLVEVDLPDSGDAWAGVWATHGHDESAHDERGEVSTWTTRTSPPRAMRPRRSRRRR